MATRKTTTKAKTKTTKKTVKKPAARAATKSTKKTVTTKVSRPASRHGNIATDTVKQLKVLNLIGAAAAASLAVLTVVFMNSTFYQKTIGYLTGNILTVSDSTDLVPAERVLFEYDIRWIIVALLVVGGAYALLNATRWRASYEKALADRVYFWRWAAIGLCGALIIELAAVSSGVTSIFTIKLMAMAMVLSAGLNWLSERQLKSGGRPVWSTYIMALIAGISPWLIVGLQILFTYIYGMVDLPWHVYAVAAVGFLGFSLSALNQLFYQRGRLSDYRLVERHYTVVNLVSVLAVSAVLLAAFWQA